MNDHDLIAGLPGEELVRQGLADREAARVSAAAYLVQMAAPRLKRAGLMDADSAPSAHESERDLYRLLGREGGDAYTRYNSLLRELASFEAALDRRMRLARPRRS